MPDQRTHRATRHQELPGSAAQTPSLHFEVSRRIKEEFGNGKHYYELHGQKIIVPSDPSQRPDAGALRWHNEQCFKG